MSKSQIHEDFQTFFEPTFDAAATQAEAFAAGVAAKSIAVLYGASGYFISIGFRRDEPPYPVHIEASALSLSKPSILDKHLNALANDAGGDVICHAFFNHSDNRPMLAMMQHAG